MVAAVKLEYKSTSDFFGLDFPLAMMRRHKSRTIRYPLAGADRLALRNNQGFMVSAPLLPVLLIGRQPASPSLPWL
jgi:hypothetical protein